MFKKSINFNHISVYCWRAGGRGGGTAFPLHVSFRVKDFICVSASGPPCRLYLPLPVGGSTSPMAGQSERTGRTALLLPSSYGNHTPVPQCGGCSCRGEPCPHQSSGSVQHWPVTPPDSGAQDDNDRQPAQVNRALQRPPDQLPRWCFGPLRALSLVLSLNSLRTRDGTGV